MQILDTLQYMRDGQPAAKLAVACPSACGRYWYDVEAMVCITGKVTALRGTIAARTAVRNQIEALVRSLATVGGR